MGGEEGYAVTTLFAEEVERTYLRTLARCMTRYFYQAHVQLPALEGRKFNPDQPRVPAGSSDGGQRTSGGGGEGDSNGIDDPGIIPVYPLEMLIGAVAGGLASLVAEEASFAVNALTILDADSIVGEIGGNLGQLVQDITDFFGGTPQYGRNGDGDLWMENDGKKIRFDINDPGSKWDGSPDDPHFHIEFEVKNGRESDWIDATPEHRIYFKKGN